MNSEETPMTPLYEKDKIDRFYELEEAYEQEQIAITKAVCTILEAIDKHQGHDKSSYYRPISWRNPEFYKIEYHRDRHHVFISFADGNERDVANVPLAYLTAPDWFTLYMEEEGKRLEERKRKNQEAQEAKERAELARLKTKYGE